MCGEDLPSDRFYMNGYLSSYCKQCQSVYKRNLYLKHKQERIGVYFSAKRKRLVQYDGTGKSKIYWSPQMRADMIKFFPNTCNYDLCQMFMISERSLLRKARELGLKKDKKYLNRIAKESGMLGYIKSKEMRHEQKQRLSENSERKEMERA